MTRGFMDAQENDITSMLTTPFSQVVAGVLLFIALVNGQQAVSLMLLLLLALIFGTRFWGRSCLSRLVLITKVDSHRLFPGNTFTLAIHIQNNGWLPAWLKIDISAEGVVQSVDGESIDAPLSQQNSLLWYQKSVNRWDLKVLRRGIYQVGASNVQAGDLFGFFSGNQQLDNFQQIMVYPKLVPLTPIPLARQDVWGVPGTVHPIKDPVYLLGTQDYQHSQPAKHIHWKASARTDCLQEKLFESTSQEKVLLLLDVMPYVLHAAEEPFERTIEVIASLGLRLLGKGQTVGLITNGDMQAGGVQSLPPSQSRRRAHTILELLAQISMSGREDFKAILANNSNMLWNVSCVYFTYCLDKSVIEVDKRLRKRRLPRAFVVCRPFSEGEDSESITVSGKLYQLKELRC